MLDVDSEPTMGITRGMPGLAPREVPDPLGPFMASISCFERCSVENTGLAVLVVGVVLVLLKLASLVLLWRPVAWVELLMLPNKSEKSWNLL